MKDEEEIAQTVLRFSGYGWRIATKESSGYKQFHLDYQRKLETIVNEFFDQLTSLNENSIQNQHNQNNQNLIAHLKFKFTIHKDENRENPQKDQNNIICSSCSSSSSSSGLLSSSLPLSALTNYLREDLAGEKDKNDVPPVSILSPDSNFPIPSSSFLAHKFQIFSPPPTIEVETRKKEELFHFQNQADFLFDSPFQFQSEPQSQSVDKPPLRYSENPEALTLVPLQGRYPKFFPPEATTRKETLFYSNSKKKNGERLEKKTQFSKKKRFNQISKQIQHIIEQHSADSTSSQSEKPIKKNLKIQKYNSNYQLLSEKTLSKWLSDTFSTNLYDQPTSPSCCKICKFAHGYRIVILNFYFAYDGEAKFLPVCASLATWSQKSSVTNTIPFLATIPFTTQGEIPRDIHRLLRCPLFLKISLRKYPICEGMKSLYQIGILADEDRSNFGLCAFRSLLQVFYPNDRPDMCCVKAWLNDPICEKTLEIEYNVLIKALSIVQTQLMKKIQSLSLRDLGSCEGTRAETAKALYHLSQIYKMKKQKKEISEEIQK